MKKIWEKSNGMFLLFIACVVIILYVTMTFVPQIMHTAWK